MDETLYHAWERYNDLLYGCPQHDLNNQQKVQIFYNRLDIPTRIMLDSKGFISLMTPTQSLKSIQVMADHSCNWYDGATTKESINNSSDNVDIKKLKENIQAIQLSCKIYEGAYLTKECSLKKEDKAVELTERVKAKMKKGKEDMMEPIPHDLPVIHPYVSPTPFPRRLKDMEDGWDIMVKDVERLKPILTSVVHTLPNLEPVMQPYMPLNSAHDETKVVREEEQDYNIPLHDGVMQPLTPQTVHITPPDDDYVAPANNPIFDMRLKEFSVELFDMTEDDEKIDGNFIEDTKELSIKTDVHSLETLTRLHSSSWATKWVKRLVAYAKCNRDSYEGDYEFALVTLVKSSSLAIIIRSTRAMLRGVSRSNPTLILEFSFP
ncbi:hypothetical protein Tco_1093055 [Tanacetum coccineum]|uniref:Uncharacterized protein n=1 Tax=Tanacetum coccineum TaxID=301880 RepID=A0ABQ5IE26_9ASTR